MYEARDKAKALASPKWVPSPYIPTVRNAFPLLLLQLVPEGDIICQCDHDLSPG